MSLLLLVAKVSRGQQGKVWQRQKQWEAGPEEKKPGAVYREDRRQQVPRRTWKQSGRRDKVGLTGLQVPHGTMGSDKEETPRFTPWRSLGWCWQTHSRLSRGVMMGAWDYGVWVVVTTSELHPQACGTHTTCLSPPHCCLDSVTPLKPCLPGRGGRGRCKICSLLECPASIWIAHDRSQTKDISSPDGVLLLESIKPIIRHSKHLTEILQPHTNMIHLNKAPEWIKNPKGQKKSKKESMILTWFH